MRIRLYILAAFVITLSALVSCNKSEGALTDIDKEVTVSYDVNIGATTKTLSSETSANYIWYGLYKINGTNIKLAKSYEPVKVVDGKAKCPVTMMLDQSYEVVFVAQYYDDNGNGVYEILSETAQMKMPATMPANTDNGDVFYAVDLVENFKGNRISDVQLKRVVSNINVFCLSEDWDAAASLNMTPTHSSVTVSNVPESFDLLTGKVSRNVISVDYTKALIPSDCHLASVYSLAGDNVTVNMRLYNSSATDAEVVRQLTVENLPVEANKRTNIKGMIMTGTLDYQITIDTESEQNYHNI